MGRIWVDLHVFQCGFLSPIDKPELDKRPTYTHETDRQSYTHTTVGQMHYYENDTRHASDKRASRRIAYAAQVAEDTQLPRAEKKSEDSRERGCRKRTSESESESSKGVKRFAGTVSESERKTAPCTYTVRERIYLRWVCTFKAYAYMTKWPNMTRATWVGTRGCGALRVPVSLLAPPEGKHWNSRFIPDLLRDGRAEALSARADGVPRRTAQRTHSARQG